MILICTASVVVQSVVFSWFQASEWSEYNHRRTLRRREQVRHERLYSEYIHSLGEGHREAFDAMCEYEKSSDSRVERWKPD